MIISHKHKFIFLKTRKTASTSTEFALNEICGPDDIVTPVTSNERNRTGLGPRNYHYRPPLLSTEWPNLISRYVRNGEMPLDYNQHMHGWRVKRRVGAKIWNSYFKFAFDRNPWDREVSWYSHHLSVARFTGSFKEHLNRLPTHKVGNFEIYSCNGKVAVDFVGRYENLETDLAYVMQQIGVECRLQLGNSNSHRRDRSKPYQEWYDEESRELIRRTYQREIELLNYSF